MEEEEEEEEKKKKKEGATRRAAEAIAGMVVDSSSREFQVRKEGRTEEAGLLGRFMRITQKQVCNLLHVHTDRHQITTVLTRLDTQTNEH